MTKKDATLAALVALADKVGSTANPHEKALRWEDWRAAVERVRRAEPRRSHALRTLTLNPNAFADDYRQLVDSMRGAVEQMAPGQRTSDRKAKRKRTRDPRIVFVVHGRDLGLRDDMFSLLRSLALKPLEWEQAVSAAGSRSPFVGDVLDAAFKKAQAVVVILSPDDEARLREPHRRQDRDRELQPQPRPNVLFEAGMALGHHPLRTILVDFGTMRMVSDLAGRHMIRPNSRVEWRKDLVNRLRDAGCKVDETAASYLTIGKFELRI